MIGSNSIYCIFSTRDDRPKYIGKTGGRRSVRFEQHKRKALNGDNGPLYRWMRAEYLDGYDIQPACLCEYVPDEEIDTQEQAWIQSIPGLLNQRHTCLAWEQGTWTIRPTHYVTIECRKYRNGRLYNHLGYHGVCYHPSVDAYTADVSFGFVNGPIWLFEKIEGDELPSGLSDDENAVWFSDLTAAITARDRKRASLEGYIRFCCFKSPELANWQWPPDRDD